MAELATVARPYAEAMFQAARGAAASGSLDDIAQQLDALAAVARDPELRQLAGDPHHGAEQLGAVMLSTLPQAAADAVRNLLQVVLENHRLAALPAIAEQFHRLKDDAQQCAEVVITSAFALDQRQLDELLPTLERRFARRLYARVEVDPALIGGVRVAVGDEVLDASVRARLDAMRNALTA